MFSPKLCPSCLIMLPSSGKCAGKCRITFSHDGIFVKSTPCKRGTQDVKQDKAV